MSKYLPAYILGKYPDQRVILASYEHDFAAGWGRKARDILENCGERLFGVKIRQDSKAADQWEVDKHGGGMQTCGVGGALTGKGCDWLLIDDPFKNAEEANSELIREKKWDWFRTAAYTRLEPNAVIIVIATRWHEADITGRILDEMKDGGEQWALLHLPVLSDSKQVRAKITIPGDVAAHFGIQNGMSFDSLTSYLKHAS